MSSDTKPIRILTADEHPILPYGIALLVAQASTGPEAIVQFRLHHPDVTLMDLQNARHRGYDRHSE